MCGSTPAPPTPPCWTSGPSSTSPPMCIWRGATSTVGWFQSSMLTSIAAKGVAPYKQIITHGWTVDGEGKAMHKSLGNAVAPEEVIKDYGADMLRLWVSSADYTQDMRISPGYPQAAVPGLSEDPQHRPVHAGQPVRLRPRSGHGCPMAQLVDLDRYALSAFNSLVQDLPPVL